MRFCLPTILVSVAMLAGCGTTKWSDTRRTATEQLLISDAMDRAVSQLDFRGIAGRQVFLDPTPLASVTDSAYLVSTLRQHMLASGCVLRDKREEADYIVEVRVGAVGTDRRELLFGLKATTIPDVIPVPGIPASLPDMPLATKTEQRAVAKIAVFAYNRKTGRPVWQSGVVPMESKAKDIWVLGAGPFQRGTIYDGMKFAGDKISIPLIYPGRKGHRTLGEVSVANEAYFAEPKEHEEQLADKGTRPKPAPATGSVVPAGHTEPVAPPAPKKTKPPDTPVLPKKTEPPPASPAPQIAKPPAPPSKPAAKQAPAAMAEPAALPPSPSGLPLPPSPLPPAAH
jgi:hypothetical protein